ncbi:hypothetical protein [Actinosynnema sp. NPDC020468]|uniref:hypothetical protein n=1 Tax=Actinosynnema sp. NPDC020468 TaxID=3154488 RepID=UPI0033DA5FFC
MDLLARQDAVQARADEVVADLDLMSALAELGDPVRTGSSALGLMYQRDIDITVACASLDLAAVTALGARLARHPRVGSVRFRNDAGSWNQEPEAYPDGLYLGPHYRDADGETWTLDLWFVDDPSRQPDLTHVRTLPPRLTPETRLAILELKQAWTGRPGYSSFGIYTAVLDHGVRTVADYETFRTSPH